MKMKFLFVVAFVAVTFTNCKKEKGSAVAEIVPEPTVANAAATDTREDFNTWKSDARSGTVTIYNKYQAVCELKSTSIYDTPRAELSDDGRFMRPNSTVTITGEFYLKKGSNPEAVGAFFQSLIFDYPTKPGTSHTSRANLMLIATDANQYKFNTTAPQNGDLYNLRLKWVQGMPTVYNAWHTVKIIIQNNTYQKNGTLQCTIDGRPMTLVQDNKTTVATTRTIGVNGASMKVGAYSMAKTGYRKYIQGTATVKNLYVTVN